MNRIFLITRPRYDDTTHYLFYWGGKLLDIAKQKRIAFLDLKQKRVNKKEFMSIVAKKQPLFIYFNGHGDSTCITGQDREVLVSLGDNEKILKYKIIYALSCKSAEKLGIESIKLGVLAFLGYNDDFIFFYDPEKISRPLDDKIAELFLEPSNKVVSSILKNHTAEEARSNSQASFMRNIQNLVVNDSPFKYLIPFLLWDMRHQVCLGDKKASFQIL